MLLLYVSWRIPISEYLLHDWRPDFRVAILRNDTMIEKDTGKQVCDRMFDLINSDNRVSFLTMKLIFPAPQGSVIENLSDFQTSETSEADSNEERIGALAEMICRLVMRRERIGRSAGPNGDG